ncbi:hypothetical protein J0B02_07520 [Enterobacteriaceae bacterium YMB-R22]|jgi:prepilin peptidase dependent protein C|uniref:prepilin-type N-terminal cleavage/methylation domain-containing protein n=1 Tax=Tenebrionicola larvae TaxID=2815733 RepID=UPI0020119D83|nr:prepilin-type N-terminal cleavage/methylation domain-containing protein [Tenebrionicola larvae]MBV4412671.1 hypothetical protein [Tenebrionicola larvae]
MCAMNGGARGFSFPETLLALLVLAIVCAGLANWQRALALGLRAQSQALRLWRELEQQTDVMAPGSDNKQITRSETPRLGCVSITVSLVGQAGYSGKLYRLHCPLNAYLSDPPAD